MMNNKEIVDELSEQINKLVSSYTCQLTIKNSDFGDKSSGGVEFDYKNGKCIDKYLIEELTRINSLDIPHQKINDTIRLRNLLGDVPHSEITSTIYSVLETYPIILSEYIKLYFVACEFKRMEMEIHDLVEKCVNVTFSKSFHDMLLIFVTSYNNWYLKLDSDIKMKISNYICSTVQQKKMVAYITPNQAEMLNKKILDAIKSVLEQININIEPIANIHNSAHDEYVIIEVKANGEPIELESTFATSAEESEKTNDLSRLMGHIKQMVKDVNEDIDMETLSEVIYIITKYKQLFEKDGNNKESDDETTIKFKLYNLHNYSTDPNIKNRLEEYYDILFNKKIMLDKNMIKYFAQNKNKFNTEIRKSIEKDIYISATYDFK